INRSILVEEECVRSETESAKLSAQKDAFGEAIGNVKDAQALAHHQALKDTEHHFGECRVYLVQLYKDKGLTSYGKE
ncbi:hypothetical protein S245_034846, partial [Arachis hypogaea]